MPRRREVPKREILPDPKYGNADVAKFVNVLMTRGKKSVAEHIVYDAFDTIKSKSELSGIQMQEEIRVAQTTSQRRLLQEDLQTERERVQIAREKLRLSQDYDRPAQGNTP